MTNVYSAADVQEAVGLVALARQLFEQGALLEARDVLQRARPVLEGANETFALAVCLHYLAATLRELGSLHEAERTFREALPVHNAAGDLEGEARSLSGLALVCRRLGRHQEAVEHYEPCLALWIRLENATETSFVQNELGVVLRELGRQEEALERFDEALAIRRDLGDSMALGITLHNRGVVLNYLGRLAESRDDLEEALPLRAVLGPAREAATHHELGQVLRKLGRAEEAIQRLDDALSLRRLVGDPGELASTLNELGLALRAVDRQSEALDRFEEALPLAEASGDPEIHGAVLHDLGVAHGDLGQPELGVRFLEAAVPLVRRARGLEGARETLGTLLDSLPNAFSSAMHRGDLQVAREYAERAIELHEFLDSPPLDRAPTHVALTTALCEIGDLDAAEAHVVQALGLIGAEPAPALRAAIANARGLIHHERGDLAQALACYQEALRLGADDDARGTRLHNVAAVYLDQGDLNHAIELFEQALTAKGDTHDRSRANTLNSLGGAHYTAESLEPAEAYFREALEIYAELAPGSVDVAIALNNLGLVLLAGSRFDEALQLFEGALEIAETEAHSGKLKGAALNNIGETHRYRSEYELALRYFERALAIEEAIAPDSSETANCRTNIAAVQCDQKAWDRAIPHLERAVAIAESLRLRAGGQRARELVFGRQQSPFELLIRSLYHRDHVGDRERALYVAESSRTRTLVELLAERELEIRPKDADQEKLLALDRRLRFDLASSHNRLERARVSADAADLVRDLEATERDLERQLDDLREQVGRLFEEYAGLRYPDPLSLEQLQARLDGETLLLEYALTGAEAFAFCVRHDDFEMLDLPWTSDQVTVGCAVALAPFHPSESGLGSGAAALKLARAASAKFSLLPLQEDKEEAGTDWGDLSRLLLGEPSHDGAVNLSRLSEALLAPIPDRLLTGVSRLLIVPAGLLSYFPFEMLPWRDGMPLVEKPYAIAYAPSATAWTSLGTMDDRRDDRPVKPFVGFGDPEFPSASGHDEASRVLHALGGTKLVRLAGTRDEVERITRSLPGSRMFLGPDATESHVKAEVAGYRFVHFATHGLLDDASPLYSGLALAPPAEAELAENPDLDDFLQVYEMFGLPLEDCEVVVCSACQTGLGRIQAGEGLIGFSRALLFAGARCVVLSLWPVPDLPSARLMERFYERLSDGDGAAEALRRAKSEVRKSHPIVYADPFTWAGFIVVGLGWKAEMGRDEEAPARAQ